MAKGKRLKTKKQTDFFLLLLSLLPFAFSLLSIA